MAYAPKPPLTLDEALSKPFTWSYSRLKNFESCGFQFLQKDVLRLHPEDESDQLKWGNRLHDALACAIGTDDNDERDRRDRIKKAPLDASLEEYQYWVDAVAGKRAQGYEVYTEMALAIDNAFQPCPWFDARGTPPRAWYRAKVDALAVNGEGHAKAWDWKTGKVKEDTPQLAMTALTVFAHFPDVHTVDTSFVWFGASSSIRMCPLTERTYKRADQAKIWAEIYPRVAGLAGAFETRTFNKNPGGLCQLWCPVESCEHHGRKHW